MDLNGKKILMTTGGGLGDMICYTPALRRMKELYPEVHITFMTKYGNHEVMEGLPYLDKVIYIHRGKFMGRFRVLPDFWRQDAVIFTDWQPQLLFFSKRFHILLRAGIPREGHRLNGYLTKHLQTNVMKSTEYAALTNAKLFSEALDIHVDGPMDKLDIAMPTAKVQEETADMLQSVGIDADMPFIVVSPFASRVQRNWPATTVKRFVTMAEQHFHMPVVITAPPQNAAEAAGIGTHVLAGRTSTMQLVEVIRRAQILVTPDSGPMHVAGAIGTKCVALFSTDLPSRWAPRHNCIPIDLYVPCSPCKTEVLNACQQPKCMQGITAEMVLEACDKLYTRRIERCFTEI